MHLKNNIAVSESGFMFDANTGDSYSLNKTGRIILKLIMEDKTSQEIAAIILPEYEIDQQLLLHYIDDFIQMLHRYELIEKGKL
jgi:hypothetical protein